MTPTSVLRRTVCPHCWENFAAEDALWISSHSDLLGDPRLGPDQQLRFLPTRFNVDGYALDAKGFVCHALACPKCHLPVPRGALEMETVFISILGEEACGKSYFLGAMTWELRRLLPKQFGLVFSDADPLANRIVNDYEKELFLHPRADDLIPLGDLIHKTQEQGELYDAVKYGSQDVFYPRPFMFSLYPKESHPRFSQRERLARLLCLYDNAGEHFRPGKDSTTDPGTQHLVRSRILLFLFDPTQDPRFLKLCNRGRDPSDHIRGPRSSRQEVVLNEAAARIRRYTGLSQNAKHNRPLTVLVTKFDVWSHLLTQPDLPEPWLHVGELVGLDLARIDQISQEVRKIMLDVCPEVVVAAESFAPSVTYMPVSALGRCPVSNKNGNGLELIRPRDIRPIWVTIPLLYVLCRGLPGMIPFLKRKPWHEEPPEAEPADSVRKNALPDR
jgi:hypothetical protein